MKSLELARLVKARQRGAYFDFPCAAHDDREPSATFHDGDRAITFLCRAGCPSKDVAEKLARKLSLRVADFFFESNGHGVNGHSVSNGSHDPLTLEAFASAKHLPVDFLREHGVEEDARGLRITYRNFDGELAPRQRRRTAIVAKEGSTWDGERGLPLIPYGRSFLDNARERGELGLLEGETDPLTAWLHNVPALGIPGADMAKVLEVGDLAGIENLWILREPDRGGATFVAGIARRLRELGWSGTATVVTLDGVKDLHELHVVAGQDFAQRLLEARARATRLGDAPPALKAADTPIPGRRAIIVKASSIEPEPVTWLWPGRIAMGALANTVGLPDQGKTLIYIDVASRLTIGSPMPPAPKCAGVHAPQRVLILTQEDSLSHTLVPRLTRAGADLDRVDFLQMVTNEQGDTSLLTLAEDLDVLEAALREQHDYALVVIDGITGYLGDAKTHNEADVRRVLAPFAALLDRVKVAGLSVMHPPKAITNLAYFAGGSVAFSAIPRVTLGVAPDPNDDRDPPRRLLMKLKGNLYGAVPTLAYRIVAADPTDIPTIEWEPESVTVNIADVIDPVRETSEERSTRRSCEDWLLSYLGDGPRPSSEVEQAADAAGFKKATLRRAREKVVDSVKVGRPGSVQGWEWTIRRPAGRGR